MNDKTEMLLAVFREQGLDVEAAEVDDRKLVKSTVPFCYQDYTHPRLEAVRRKYALDEIVAAGSDEFHRMLLLRRWVHETIPRGDPVHGVMDMEAILDSALDGGTFYCTHYAWVYMSCAVALGWQARKLGIDSFHGSDEDSTHHGVAEIWSNRYAKWVVMDAMYDINFEREGAPLSARELREQWIKDRSESVQTTAGPGREVTATGAPERAFDSPACYFWFHVCTRNDFYSMPEKYGNYRCLTLQDRHNKGLIWYQGKGSEGAAYPHSCYRGMFLATETPDDLSPSIGSIEFGFEPGDGPGNCAVHLRHFTPNFSHHRIEMNGKTCETAGDRVVWTPAPGENVLAARTVNLAGIEGPPSTVRLVVKE
ncbi:MAG: transglutaminase domain-containing protein [Planctomycetes bacterium]|nr:transglutaminase domain-containing protein [Planctomycetota bacterium]